MEAGRGVALELSWLGLAAESSGSAGACSSHRIALTGFLLGHLLSRFIRNWETGGAARRHLPNVPRGSSKRQVSSWSPRLGIDPSGELSAQRSWAAIHRIHSGKAGISGFALCGGDRNHAAAAKDLPAELENGDRRFFSRFRCDHRRVSDGRAHTVQAGRMDRTLHRQESHTGPRSSWVRYPTLG